MKKLKQSSVIEVLITLALAMVIYTLLNDTSGKALMGAIIFYSAPLVVLLLVNVVMNKLNITQDIRIWRSIVIIASLLVLLSAFVAAIGGNNYLLALPLYFVTVVNYLLSIVSLAMLLTHMRATKKTMQFKYFPQEDKSLITFDINESVDFDTLIVEFCLSSSITLIKNELVHSCMGPVEVIHEIQTSEGNFFTYWCGEGLDEGYEIYSENKKLIGGIYKYLSKSDSYNEISKST